jgi:hypothetical protein
MGALFSIITASFGLAALVVVAFAVACIFRRPAVALALALLFALGAAGGVMLAAAISVAVLGVGPTLESASHVIAYLSYLAASGVLGGVLLCTCTASVLTRCSSGPPPAAAERQR